MARKQNDRSRPPNKASKAKDANHALPPGKPGANPRVVEVTGVVPPDVHVDPFITEGHPGYEESGSSEIIPADRLRKPASQQKPSS